MHATIIDLQSLLHAQLQPTIIALAETKNRHNKSIWRYTLKNYKLVFNPFLYNKKTKRASAGTILAIHKAAYTNIQPIHTPTTLQPYLVVALIQLKYISKILAASTYMPQLNTL
jgi:hypothetical protein